MHVANASVSTTTHTIHRTKLAFMDYSMRLMFYADCDFNENDFERVVPLIAVMGEIVTVSAAFFEPLGTSRDGPCCCFACLHGLVACVCVHSRGFKPSGPWTIPCHPHLACYGLHAAGRGMATAQSDASHAEGAARSCHRGDSAPPTWCRLHARSLNLSYLTERDSWNEHEEHGQEREQGWEKWQRRTDRWKGVQGSTASRGAHANPAADLCFTSCGLGARCMC